MDLDPCLHYRYTDPNHLEQILLNYNIKYVNNASENRIHIRPNHKIADLGLINNM